MPEWKIDLHCHSHFSADGVSHPLRMVERARELGLDGFVLTDHDTPQGIDYLREQGLIRLDGRAQDGFLIIPGQEVSTQEGHVLVIGIRLESMPGIRCGELLEKVHQMGGLCVAAHPFDPARRGVGRNVLTQTAFDGIEVFNAASWLPGLNATACRFARLRGLLMTAGSDSHHPASLGCSHQIIDAELLSVTSILEALREKKCRRQECLMRVQDYVLKSWYNLFRPKTPVDDPPQTDTLSGI